ncbi:MAG: hypothetical protein P4L46_07260 [Fimbriimonas sp.]|nr:hypothetical protein [Fimbriimonas sp.]
MKLRSPLEWVLPSVLVVAGILVFAAIRDSLSRTVGSSLAFVVALVLIALVLGKRRRLGS